MTCPRCGHEAHFEGYRPLNHVRTLVGQIVYERAYYSCRTCHHGYCPTDKEFHLEDERTPGYREVVALAGVRDAFAEGAERVLHRMTGVRASASTVQRVTEAVGVMYSKAVAAGQPLQAESIAWSWNVDAHGRKVAYVSVDATSVPQQGPRGEKRDGRMPLVGTIFNAAPCSAGTRRAREIRDVHYRSGLMSLDDMSCILRTEAVAVGLDQAEIVIALTDGGAGLEDCLLNAVSGLSKETIAILDFHHAHDHLVEFGKVFCEDNAIRLTQVSAWSTMLKERGGPALLSDLQTLDLSTRSPAVVEAHRQLTGYLRNNSHRTDYPKYLENGWQIGSGVVESACKRVVGQRLKRGGMRWREPGTEALCQARSLYLSSDQRWEFFWSHIAAG